MKGKTNNFNTVPFSGERLQQHRNWMRVMSEGELTPALNRKIDPVANLAVRVQTESTSPKPDA